MSVIVIAGGLSHERDVSLRSGRRVAQALRDAGLDVVETDVSADLVSLIRGDSGAVVVPMLHGGLGRTAPYARCWTCFGCRSWGRAARLRD